MTERPAQTTSQEQQRTQTRLALGAMLIPLFFVTMFALCIIGTYHKPHPNDIKVGVVGPAVQTAQLRAGMAKAAGSAFDIGQVTTAAQAAHAVRQRDLDAAFVPTANPKQPATVMSPTPAGASRRPRPRRSPAPSRRSRGPSSSCATSAPWRPATRSGSACSCS